MKTKYQSSVIGFSALVIAISSTACSPEDSEAFTHSLIAPQEPLGNSLPRALIVGAGSDSEKLNVANARGQVLYTVSRENELAVTPDYLIEKKPDGVLTVRGLKSGKSMGEINIEGVEEYKLTKNFIAYQKDGELIVKSLTATPDAEPLIKEKAVDSYLVNDGAIAYLRGGELVLVDLKTGAAKVAYHSEKITEYKLSNRLLVSRNEDSFFRITKMNGDTHELTPNRPIVETFELNDQFLVFVHADQFQNKYIDVINVSRAESGIIRPIANVGAQSYLLTKNAVVYTAPTGELIVLGTDGKSHLRARVTSDLDQIQITDDVIVYREAFVLANDPVKNPVHVYRLETKKSEYLSVDKAIDEYLAIDDVVIYRINGETSHKVLGASGYRGDFKLPSPAEAPSALNFEELKTINEPKLKKFKSL